MENKKIRNLIVKMTLGAMGIGMTFLMAGCGKPTINLNDYLVIEENGVNGYGSVSVSVDWNGIEEDYGDKLELTKAGEKKATGFFSFVEPVEFVREFVDLDEESKQNLSNGDEVSYTWDVEESYKDLLNCKLKWKDGTYTVETLKEVDTFDAFADIEVSFNGVSPQGSVNIVCNGELITSYDVTVSQNSQLSNGDIITLSLESINMEAFAKKYGKLPAELTKEYTVEGLDIYVSSMEQVNEESLAELKKLAEDEYLAEAASNWKDGITVESLEYVGNYMLTPKSSESNTYENIIFLVYHAKADIDYTYYDYGNFKSKQDIYWYLAPVDIIVDAEGQIKPISYSSIGVEDIVEVDTLIDSSSWTYYTKKLRFDGYESLEILKHKNITTRIDQYNYEENF